MRNLMTVFWFTFKSYAKHKAYIITTAGLVVIVGVMLSWPRIGALLDMGGNDDAESSEKVAIVGEDGAAELFIEGFDGTEYIFEDVYLSKEQALAAVESGEYKQVIFLDSPAAYTRITENLPLNDTFGTRFNALMKKRYQLRQMLSFGATRAQAAEVLEMTPAATVEFTASGKNQAERFWNVYIMLFVLYFAIMLYGQMIASSVATEKSSRAMEVLITATDTKDLMFGKVLGTSAAGLLQLSLTLGGMFLAFRANATYHEPDGVISGMFNMSASIFGFAVVFFLLGFLLYAFVYAAFASFVSRMEELNNAVLPATLVYVFSFVGVMFSMATGNMDSFLMAVCSFVPFTSPLAMFARIALTSVPAWQIALSVGVLTLSVLGMGYMATLIYRVGVLMYGARLKPGVIIRQLRMIARLR
ncbi:MAG: ABC transporter permease [Clostridiales bacterium]|jgi:ABC-2 type transport system permease protein|nr:ABC transporter permease [Clostridiales bacterium]